MERPICICNADRDSKECHLCPENPNREFWESLEKIGTTIREDLRKVKKNERS